MNRDFDTDDFIDLGAASIETRGPSFGHDDTANGLIPVAGLTEE